MLISSAFAADQAQAAQQNPIAGFLFPVILLVIFYFMIWRPQSSRNKEAKKVQESLQKGAEVVTEAGMVGKVVKISDQYVTLDIGGGTEATFQRAYIKTILPKGTIKDI